MKLKIMTKFLTQHPEKVFAVLAIIFGLSFVFGVHPLYGNDEIVHFPRAYQISEGNLWTDHLRGYDYGGQVPVQIKQFNDSYREQVQSDSKETTRLEEIQARYDTEKLTDQAREELAFSSAGVYSPWSYIPSSLGVMTARLMNLSLNWFVYMGRLLTLLTYIALVYAAIKFLPFGKLFLVVVALLPTSLTQAANLGMDGLVNGFSWLIIALTLAVFTGKLRLSTKVVSLLGFLSLFLATTKQAYGLIALLPLLIPARLYPFSYRLVWLWRGILGGVLLITGLWYIGYTSHIAEMLHFVQRPGLNINEADQLHYIFQHPIQFIAMILIQPFTLWGANVWAGIVGVITNRTIFLPIVVILGLFATMFVALFERERPHIAKRDKLFIVGASAVAFAGTFVLINLALYIAFTRVGYDHVEGLQGRYFLPLLPLVGILLHVLMPELFLKISHSQITTIAYGGILIGLVSALVVL
jgi:uncharacterized membrane protein